MKNLLCKLGFHHPDKYRYLTVRKTRGQHKWHTNYVVCRRCGKRIATFGVKKRPPEGEEDA